MNWSLSHCVSISELFRQCHINRITQFCHELCNGWELGMKLKECKLLRMRHTLNGADWIIVTYKFTSTQHKIVYAHFSSIKRINTNNYPKQLNSVVINADPTQCNQTSTVTNNTQLHRQMQPWNTDVSITQAYQLSILWQQMVNPSFYKCCQLRCLRNSHRKKRMLNHQCPAVWQTNF